MLRLTSLLLASLLLAAAPAMAQSLSPMRLDGKTPSDVKGYRLAVGNPYKQRMTFIALAMDPKFEHQVDGALVQPAEFKLAPGASRSVIVQFKIDPSAKERTIAVCVLPKAIEGPVIPRVCGTYTGRMLTRGGG